MMSRLTMDAPLAKPNPWVPMTDPRALKALGKLGEECGELADAAGALIHRRPDEEPLALRPALQDELADVLANIEIVEDHFALDLRRIDGLIEVRKRVLAEYSPAGLVDLLRAAGQLSAGICRCIIQGIDEREPVTGKLNRDMLEERIAAMSAAIDNIERRHDLDLAAIDARYKRKLSFIGEWLAMLPERAA